MSRLFKSLSTYRKSVSSKLEWDGHLTVVLLIGLLSFLIFYMLFNQVRADNYLREIVSALIATILTVTITTFLLKAQSRSEELKERNVELLCRKIDSYGRFVERYLSAMDEDGLNPADAEGIRKEIYHLALFSEAATVEKATQLFRGHLLEDVEEITLSDVIQAFREELHLDISDDPLGDGMDAIDKLLAIGFDHLPVFKEFLRFSERIQEDVEALADEQKMGLSVERCYGLWNGNNFRFTNCKNVLYSFIIYYPDEKDGERITCLVSLLFDNEAGPIDSRLVDEVVKFALANGYSNGDEDEREGQPAVGDLASVGGQEEAAFSKRIEFPIQWSCDQKSLKGRQELAKVLFQEIENCEAVVHQFLDSNSQSD